MNNLRSFLNPCEKSLLVGFSVSTKGAAWGGFGGLLGESVWQLIRMILLTALGERVMRPRFGCRLG